MQHNQKQPKNAEAVDRGASRRAEKVKLPANIRDLLDEIRCGLIDVETAIAEKGTE